MPHEISGLVQAEVPHDIGAMRFDNPSADVQESLDSFFSFRFSKQVWGWRRENRSWVRPGEEGLLPGGRSGAVPCVVFRFRNDMATVATENRFGIYKSNIQCSLTRIM
jgi:hypothetical protein